jgi:hypothetical protein
MSPYFIKRVADKYRTQATACYTIMSKGREMKNWKKRLGTKRTSRKKERWKGRPDHHYPNRLDLQKEKYINARLPI